MAAKTRGLVQKKECLLGRFRGALVGAVVGDCLGAHFENAWNVDVQQVVDFFARLPTISLKTGSSDSESETEADAKTGTAPTAVQDNGGKQDCKEGKAKPKKGKKHFHAFTDDTAMARSVAASLTKQKKVDARDVAERFTKEYEREPWRGYGGSVGAVFKQLKDANYQDPHGPASLQFDGSGSYGNGGAMRIVPATLFGYHMDEEHLNSAVDDITRVTHTHRDALNGAKLQAAAVREALRQESGPLPDTAAHLIHLQTLAASLESTPAVDRTGSPSPKRRAKRKSESGDKPYCDKLQLIQKYLDSETEISRSELEDTLGNDVSALGSVPAAIYCFLRATRPISDIPVDSPFERTIIYAVTLGGDTDTIATMAGAMAGAYYGLDAIPQLWRDTCEGVEDALTAASQLHRMVLMDNGKDKEEGGKTPSESETGEKVAKDSVSELTKSD